MKITIFNAVVNVNIENFKVGERNIQVTINGKIAGMKVAVDARLIEGSIEPITISIRVKEDDSHA